MVRKTCNECLTEFEAERVTRRFCSKTCATRQNNRLYKKREKVVKNCMCGKPARAKYCSQKCGEAYKNKARVEAWLTGKDNGTRFSTTAKFIKPYLIETRGNKCEICEWSKVHPRTGIVPIQLNHKDGNWQNNKVDNLELLCPSCHALTDNYGGANKGKGRAHRGKYNQFAVLA